MSVEWRRSDSPWDRRIEQWHLDLGFCSCGVSGRPDGGASWNVEFSDEQPTDLDAGGSSHTVDEAKAAAIESVRWALTKVVAGLGGRVKWEQE